MTEEIEKSVLKYFALRVHWLRKSYLAQKMETERNEARSKMDHAHAELEALMSESAESHCSDLEDRRHKTELEPSSARPNPAYL